MSKAKENSQIVSKLLSDVGSLVTADSDSLELLSPGTDGQVLTADSTQPKGIKWASAGASGFTPTQVTDLTDAGDSTLHYHASDRALGNATGTLAVANGGTASTTAQTAINVLTAVAGATAGDVLTKSGTDAVWLAPSGAGIGDVTGPASSVDNNLANFNGTSGKTIEDSGIGLATVATLAGTQTLTNKTIGAGSTWSGNAIGALSGGTAQTSYIKGDILYSSATNTLAKLPVGAVGQVLAVGGAGVPSWVTNTTTGFIVPAPSGGDDSTAIQSVINSCSAAGGGVVNLEAGTYVINASLIIPSYVTLKGRGMDVTHLRLKNGVNVPVVTTTNTATLDTGDTAGGAKYWGLLDLTIDGNRANNTSGHGVYTYSRAYYINNVKVEYCATSGIYTRWCSGCAAWSDDVTDSIMESMIDNVFIQFCGQRGLHFDGPHDGRVNNTIVAICSASSSGVYDGIYVGPRAGGAVFTTCHSWGDTQRYAWNISGNYIYATNCIADDAYTALVYVNGTHFSWTGGHAFGAVWNSPPTATDLAMKGFVLSSNAWHPHIVTMVTDAPQGAVDFTSAPNGSGTIIVNGSLLTALNTYATTYGYVGTPPSNLNVQINIFDPDNNDSYYSTASLPSQTGNANKVLTTNGTAASWTTALKLYTNTVQFNVRSGTPSDTTWAAGQVYYDTSTNKLRCFNGTSWFDLF